MIGPWVRSICKIVPSRQRGLQRRSGQESAGESVPVGKSVSVNDQFFLGEKLERAVAFHIDGVAKMAVGGRKHRNDGAGFMMVVGCFVDLVADCKLCHRKLLSELLRQLRHKLVN